MSELKRKDRESSGGEESFYQERKEERKMEMENEQASKGDIMMIIEKINSAKLDTERQILNAKEQTVKSFTEQISSVNATIHELRVENDHLKKEVDTLKEVTQRQRGEIEDLKGVTKMHRDTLVELQQRSRIDNLKIYGLREQGGEWGESAELTGRVVRDFFYRKLGVDVRSSDISIAHRLQANDRGDRPRTVIVKFTRRSVKNEILKNRKKLRGCPVVIAEDLSNTNMRLFHAMRDKVGHNAWTWDGKVFVSVGGAPKRVTLDNEAEITLSIKDMCDRGEDPRARAPRAPRAPRGRDSRGQGQGRGRGQGRDASPARDRPREQYTGPGAPAQYSEAVTSASARDRSHSSERHLAARSWSPGVGRGQDHSLDRDPSRDRDRRRDRDASAGQGNDRGRDRSRGRERSRQWDEGHDRYRDYSERRDRDGEEEVAQRSPVFGRGRGNRGRGRKAELKGFGRGDPL